MRAMAPRHSIQFFNRSRSSFEEKTAQERMESIFSKMSAIQQRATNQKRQLTAAETAEIEALAGEFATAEAEAKLEALNSRSRGRQTQADGGRPADGNRARARMNGDRGATWDSVFEHPGLAAVATGAAKHSGEIPLPGIREIMNVPLTSDPPLSPAESEQYEVQPRRLDRFGNDPRLRFSLIRMLPTFPLTFSNALEFPQLDDDPTGALREADYQGAEGSNKKESSFGNAMTSFPVRTFAHWKRISRQLLGDVPLLRGQLSSLLTYGALKKLERELVNGTGTGGAIEGLITAATAFSATGGLPAVDRVGECAATLQTEGWDPNLVVLNPLDYFAFASERVTDGEYINGGGWSSPVDTPVWSMRKALTPFLSAGTALVLDSSQVAILDREQATLIVESGGHQNVIANLVTMLCELRAGLAIFSPAAIRSVTLT